MPIITKPGSVVKDTANSFSLSKSSLAALSIVSSDAWFSQQSNWKKVRVNYISSVGNQFISVIFDATQANPTGTFYAMSPCRDNFEVFNIVIEDFNRGSLKIDSSLLTKSEFAVSFGGGGGGNSFTVYKTGAGNISYVAPTLTNSGTSSGLLSTAVSSNSLASGDGYVQFTHKAGDYFCGLIWSMPDATGVFTPNGNVAPFNANSGAFAKIESGYLYVQGPFGGPVFIGAVAVNDVIKIAKSGNNIVYYKNGTVVDSANGAGAASGRPYPMKASFSPVSLSASVDNLDIFSV